MKSLSPLLRFVLPAVFVLAVYSCQQHSDEKIPFDAQRAAQHIIPYDSVVSYVNAYTQEKKRLYSMVKDSAYLRESFNMAAAETFNRDAIIALLDAPGAESVRIYYGKKKNGQVVLVLLPVDKNNNDIKVNLTEVSRQTSLNIPGISSAQATPPPPGAQGVEDGQRCPTACGTNSDLNLE